MYEAIEYLNYKCVNVFKWYKNHTRLKKFLHDEMCWLIWENHDLFSFTLRGWEERLKL